MKIQVPGCLALAVHDRRWFVLRVRTAYDLSLKGGATDIAFASLRESGYDVYLPRRRYDRHNRRLRVMAEWSEPLLPGYLFVVHPRPGMTIDDWDEVRSIKEVVGPLGSAAGPLRVPPAVVEALMDAEFGSVYDETAAGRRMRGETDRHRLESRFPAGSQFIVTSGPFSSYLAEVRGLTHDDRVTALVEILGRMVPVKFEAGQLEDAPKPGRPAAT